MIALFSHPEVDCRCLLADGNSIFLREAIYRRSPLSLRCIFLIADAFLYYPSRLIIPSRLNITHWVVLSIILAIFIDARYSTSYWKW